MSKHVDLKIINANQAQSQTTATYVKCLNNTDDCKFNLINKNTNNSNKTDSKKPSSNKKNLKTKKEKVKIV